MSQKKSQKDKEKSMLLALLLFFGAAFLIFMYLGSDDGKLQSGPAKVAKSEKYEQSVNRHLMMTNERIEMEKQRMQVENARLLNSGISAVPSQKPYMNETQMDLSYDTRAAELANELGRGDKKEEVITPHDAIQRDLFNAQQMQEYSQAYKEEYARQFIENARRGGYKVILSEDLSRVISVTPIRRPTQNMEIFDARPGAIQ